MPRTVVSTEGVFILSGRQKLDLASFEQAGVCCILTASGGERQKFERQCVLCALPGHLSKQ